MKKRIIAYIDGYNLYYGIKDVSRFQPGWKRFYWLDLQRLMRLLIRPTDTLVFTKYFTTRVGSPPRKAARQNTFLEALQTLPEFEMQFGQFTEDPRVCRGCQASYMSYDEKMTDVNLAVSMMTDAFLDRFDCALLVSADSDLTGLVNTVRQLFPSKTVDIAFPPARHSNALQLAANYTRKIKRSHLEKSVLPIEVTRADGFILRRPAEWQ